MTFPAWFWKKPFSWQQGYINGRWKIPDKPADKLTEADKTPPEPNPCVAGTQPWRDWEAGFQAGKQSIQERGS